MNIRIIFSAFLLFLISTPTPGFALVLEVGAGKQFATIQACANAAIAGDTCLISAGTYPESVKTKASGISPNPDLCEPLSGTYPDFSVATNNCIADRITFKAQGHVIMNGFEVRHEFITIDGFDITGTSGAMGFITIYGDGNYAQILNNNIHEGQRLVSGIMFDNSRNLRASFCTIRGNVFKKLTNQMLMIDGVGHLVERNLFTALDGWDVLRTFGHDHLIRGNLVQEGLPVAGIGNHPDFIQTFADNGGEAYNIVIQENFIMNLVESLNKETGYQMSQMNSGGSIVRPFLDPNFHDFMFRRNVFFNISNNMNVGMPGVQFTENVFYKAAHAQSGLIFGGSETRGESSRTNLKNNLFIDCGNPSGSKDAGFYAITGQGISSEVLAIFVTKEVLSPDAPPTISKGLFDELLSLGYVNGNGLPTAKAKALTASGQLVLSSQNSSFQAATFEILKTTVRRDTELRNTFSADYNFVAGHSSDGYPAKQAFHEVHGINGGNPQLTNPTNPLGPDGIPFTLDDGLKPKANSPLCHTGVNGIDMGLYSCDPNQVFANSSAEVVAPPPDADMFGCSARNIRCVPQEYATIQLCDNAAMAGDTCLVSPGNYPEHVETVAGGLANAYITFKAVNDATNAATTEQQRSTMRGFRIKHPYIRVEGFDITGYAAGLDQGNILIEPFGDYAHVLSNSIHDGVYLTSFDYSFDGANRTISNPAGGFLKAGFVPGILIYIGSNINKQILNHDKVFTVKAVTDTTLTVADSNTLLTESNVNSTIYMSRAEKIGLAGIRLNASSQYGTPDSCVIKGNILSNLAGPGMSIAGSKHLIDGNIFEKMNGWRMVGFAGNNITFSRNIFRNSKRWPGFDAPLPGTPHSIGTGTWDMYDTLMTSTPAPDQTSIDNVFEFNFIQDIDNQFATVNQTSALNSIGLESRGFTLRNNVFIGMEKIGSFTRPETKMINNTFYKNAPTSRFNFVIGKSDHGDPIGSRIANNVFVDCNYTTDPNGQAGWYSIQTADHINDPNVTADYNFVAGPASLGYPEKKDFKGAEVHGINGKNPLFQNIDNPLGPDGLPFTADDGLRPLATSPLCKSGEDGLDLGAYSCVGSNPNQGKPLILFHPRNKTVAAGQTAEFSVTADSKSQTQYQWYRNNIAITGAKSATYTIPSASTDDHLSKFKVIITNNYGSITSQQATLTVTGSAGGNTGGDTGGDPNTSAQTPRQPIFNPLKGETLIIDPTLPSEGTHVSIFDRNGNVVKTISQANSSTTWDGRNDEGQIVAAGIYSIRANKKSIKVIVIK